MIAQRLPRDALLQKLEGKAGFQLDDDRHAVFDRHHIRIPHLRFHDIAQRLEMRFDGGIEIGFAQSCHVASDTANL